MGELAFIAVWAIPFFREVSAERTLNFIFGTNFLLPTFGKDNRALVIVIAVSGGFGNCVEGDLRGDSKG